jgi:D-threo-aldose 1-dehydrogenase
MEAYKEIGRTGLKIPGVGFGSASIGNLYSEVPETRAIETIQYALEKGICFFDTAPQYGAGLAEERIGLALHGVNRDEFIIETKIGRLIMPDKQEVFDYSRDGVLRSLESSLKRMKIDYVDSLLIHDPDAGAPSTRYIIEETFPALATLKAEGVVKAIGIGINYWQMLLELLNSTEFDCFMLAGRYTLLEQTALDALASFQVKGVSVIGAGVYNSGILATGTRSGLPPYYQYKPAVSGVIERVRKLEAICDQFNVILPMAAIQFVAAHPAMTSLVIGLQTKQEIDATLAYFQQPIPDEFWLALRDQQFIEAAAPLPLSSAVDS